MVLALAGNIPQRTSRLKSTSREFRNRWLEDTVLALIRPAIADTRPVALVAKLLGQKLLIGASVARRGGDLLEEVERGNGVQRCSAEAVDAGVQRAAQGRGDEGGDGGVVREGGAQGGALLQTERGEVWVVDGFVFYVEVVVALGVTDEVDCRRHGERWDE